MRGTPQSGAIRCGCENEYRGRFYETGTTNDIDDINDNYEGALKRAKSLAIAALRRPKFDGIR